MKANMQSVVITELSRDGLCTDLTRSMFVLDNLKGSGPMDWQQHVWSDPREQA